MSPVTHYLSGWVLANCVGLDRKDRAIVTFASLVPDIDGLGIVPELLTRNSPHPLLWFSLFHHALHNLAFALVVAVLATGMANRRLKTGLLAFVSFHLHLLEDVLGSRGADGYQWPVPYLAPFSKAWELSWAGEWRLDAWQNIVITIALLIVTLWLAWRRGFSPLELISAKADGVLVRALRQRLPRHASEAIQ